MRLTYHPDAEAELVEAARFYEAMKRRAFLETAGLAVAGVAPRNNPAARRGTANYPLPGAWPGA
jgi:hypothetical protein